MIEAAYQRICLDAFTATDGEQGLKLYAAAVALEAAYPDEIAELRRNLGVKTPPENAAADVKRVVARKVAEMPKWINELGR